MFQNARDAIKTIKRAFSVQSDPVIESLKALDEARNGIVFTFAKELDNLTEKYEILKADYERVSQAWGEINGRYSKLETRFGSLYEFICEDCTAKWNYIVDREDEDAEQC